MQCFFFHRVLGSRRVDDFTDLEDPTCRDFESLVRRLARKHRIVSTAELLDLQRSRRRPGPDWVHLSFDDGFASTLRAGEICARLGVPLTVFVTSRVLDGFVPWYVRCMAALSGARRSVRWQGRGFDLRRIGEARALAAGIKESVYSSGGDPSHRTEAILSELGLPIDGAIPDKLRFLTRAELRQLAGLGVEIGSHGVTHASFTASDDASLCDELTGSREALTELLGAPPTAVSYPDGRHDARVEEASVRAGYRIGFAVDGPHEPWEPLAIPRRCLARNVEFVGRPLALGRAFGTAGAVKVGLHWLASRVGAAR